MKHNILSWTHGDIFYFVYLWLLTMFSNVLSDKKRYPIIHLCICQQNETRISDLDLSNVQISVMEMYANWHYLII